MRSSIIGYLPNANLFAHSAAMISTFSGENDHYDEFKIGDWKTFVIRNASGADNDGFVGGEAAPTRPTARGHMVPELNQWIERHFRLDLLRLARVHSLGDGVLIPHRDFVEFEGDQIPWTRVHIPIQTNAECLHGEEDCIFRMHEGEVWHFDATRLHSATNFGAQRRFNLCLDFDLADLPLTAIFQRPEEAASERKPEIVERPAVTKAFEAGLLGLSRIIEARNYRTIVGLLSRVPFYRDAPLDQVFEWLLSICYESGNSALYEKTAAFSRFLRDERVISERFAL
ncbi:aspartyl/asparaginyl beta-hydroxylase domain-containing protein [Sphingobium sp.]|uniref:aspartyl/asparaginyl beta-hydroxylase domain-containing protein n=1 Tax=Sphingobium sp. TaxID=1912891 RepID=UPI000DB73C79|nr:aspartyl/asparaginyl beta-hydroxylase domain-containing protein [Sphingobium sp.]PZU68645.1 MAG: hypothetical protein DI540_07800 [Sphingobium sp.]